MIKPQIFQLQRSKVFMASAIFFVSNGPLGPYFSKAGQNTAILYMQEKIKVVSLNEVWKVFFYFLSEIWACCKNSVKEMAEDLGTWEKQGFRKISERCMLFLYFVSQTQHIKKHRVVSAFNLFSISALMWYSCFHHMLRKLQVNVHMLSVS